MDLLSKEKEVVGIYISGHPLDDYRFEIKSFCNSNLLELSNLDTAKGKQMNFSGVVIDVEHKETKNGKKYGVILLEDYSSSFKFFLFGDDYIKYKSFLSPSWLLLISGRVNKKFYNDDLEFKISSINILSELIDAEVRDLVISIDFNNVEPKLNDNLVEIITKNKGKHSVIFNFIDAKNNYNSEVLSRKFKVDLNKEFINELNNFNKIGIKIK
jgi:DNA polymerase-3 subunit alpha